MRLAAGAAAKLIDAVPTDDNTKPLSATPPKRLRLVMRDVPDGPYSGVVISIRVGLNRFDPSLHLVLIWHPANLDRASIGVIGCRRPFARTAAHCALHSQVRWR